MTFEERQKLFLEEVRQLEEKHHVKIVAVVDYRRSGVVPLLGFLDSDAKPQAPEEPVSNIVKK